jgi:subtilisin-like proprotein convertase family protein
VAAQIEIECVDSNCSAALGDDSLILSSIEGPVVSCDQVDTASVRLTVQHTWVGDLRVALKHEPSQTSVMLLDRPGVPDVSPFGCPGEGVDAVFDDTASARGDDTCDLLIPAIPDEVRSSQRGRRLVIDPDEPPFEIDGCPFVRFEGALDPLINGTSFLDAGCPPFVAGADDDRNLCRFRGRWNPDCGNDQLVARLERNGQNLVVRLLDLTNPTSFRATATTAFEADLDTFNNGGGDTAVSGGIDLSDTGLTAFSGVGCAGTWTLQIADEAAPNTGALVGWTLILQPAAPATPTQTAAATSTSTGTVTPTPTVTPSITQGGPTLTPAATPTPSSTPTQTPTLTATITPGGPTLTPTATPTQTPTLTATITPGGPTLTPTPTVGDRPCGGDCNEDGFVTVDEVVLAVNIALGLTPLDDCQNADADGDGMVNVDDLVEAVRNLLQGCP